MRTAGLPVPRILLSSLLPFLEKDSTFTEGSEKRLAREFSKRLAGRVYAAKSGRTPQRNLSEALQAIAGFLAARCRPG
jgi:hypothetical protein